MSSTFLSLPSLRRLSKAYAVACIALMIVLFWLCAIVFQMSRDAYLRHQAYVENSIELDAKIIDFVMREFPGRAASHMAGEYPVIAIEQESGVVSVPIDLSGPTTSSDKEKLLGTSVRVRYIKGQPQSAVVSSATLPSAFPVAINLLLCVLVGIFAFLGYAAFVILTKPTSIEL